MFTELQHEGQGLLDASNKSATMATKELPAAGLVFLVQSSNLFNTESSTV